MQSCWESDPNTRPQFCELVSTISSILESAAGYLELGTSLQLLKSEYERSEMSPAGSEPGSDNSDFIH